MSKHITEEHKLELKDILLAHDTTRFKLFVLAHRNEFRDVMDSQIDDPEWLSDCMHVYKSMLLYMGEEHAKSLEYCVRKGLIKINGTESK